MKPYMGDYGESFIRDRAAGTPLRHPEMIDVSEELLGRQKGGALLVTSGVPDFVLTPIGLAAGLKANGIDLGIQDRERCDVVKIFGCPDEATLRSAGLPDCGVCGRGDQVLHIWKVKHRRIGAEFALVECRCKQINWVGPTRMPKKEDDSGEAGK